MATSLPKSLGEDCEVWGLQKWRKRRKGRGGDLQPCIKLASCSAHSFLSSIKERWRYPRPVIPSAELHLSGSEPCSQQFKTSKLSNLGQILL